MHAATVAETLRARGLRLTGPRWEILRYLEGNDRHPTAQDIFNELAPAHPGLSLTTVYNTLSMLQEVGAVAVMPQGDGPQRYDANPAPHVNLVCRDCGQVLDAPSDELASLLDQAARRHGFELATHVVEAQGRCGACSSRNEGLPPA